MGEVVPLYPEPTPLPPAVLAHLERIVVDARAGTLGVEGLADRLCKVVDELDGADDDAEVEPPTVRRLIT